MTVGLRIDVDTFRGTRLGVPALCSLLKSRGIKATFFFSAGPDNMGRHLWRLLKPQFLLKMLRSKAASLYGWDIIFMGTFWQGPIIADKLRHVIKAAYDDGHEIGLHAWDHHQWQAEIDSMSSESMQDSFRRGMGILSDITGETPRCSAVPGWKCNDRALIEKSRLPFIYNSDCRGSSIFHPVVDGRKILQPQIPTTLPTYDELIGRNGITGDNYNDHIISLVKPDSLNVLTIHAEAEGIACLGMFSDFLDKARKSGIGFVPLSKLLEDIGEIPGAEIRPCNMPGREGWTACQR
ncbi:MAG TPA: 4-deoxy-4-formamido-L-arabinose-phosphoundecaprenol deformylase [Lentisphaeria bacterium]|nr:MAG: 4-deoxy-4-formamido-L-arabinose-phosphoundecaprenol deformylase [Lentisphaerae bacterium GWF2_50_93]HCE46630.1 4-deoxy-4-formamido-L-arabinose-phosphoundecaprenol deformylase [Lentisphaeria bacterium]